MNLLQLDADVAFLEKALTSARQHLLRREAEESPADPFALRRFAAGQTAYQQLTDFKATLGDEFLRQGLQRWVAELIVARIAWPSEVRLVQERRKARVPAPVGQPRLMSLEDAVVEFLRVPDPRQALLHYRALGEASESVHGAWKEWWDLRWEVAHRLGLPSPFALTESVPTAAVQGAAEAFLRATDAFANDLLKEARSRDVGAECSEPVLLRDALLVKGASEGWPARLTLRWATGLFAPSLFRGVSLPRLPFAEPLGAMSFARALGQVGVALAEGAVSSRLPFSVARTPAFRRGQRLGGVFGALPMIRVFHQKLLGTTRGRSEDQARWVARGGLFALRVAAFRARLATERNLSGSAFEELSARVFGAPLPPSLHGVFPRVRGHEATVWSGLLEALDVEGTLMDRFDEDWFLNPRAAEFLRANLAGPAWEPADEAGWDERAQRLAHEMKRRAT